MTEPPRGRGRPGARSARPASGPGAGGGSDDRGRDGSEPGPPDEPPPFLGSWARLYAIVALELATLILLFHWFTRAFA